MKPGGRKVFCAHGFTLLEVVVAMTIVGLGVVTLLEVFSLGLRLGVRSSLRTEALLDGSRIMDEFLARRNLREGTEQGSLPDGSRWRLQIQPLKPPSDSLALASEWEMQELSLDLNVNDAGRERRTELKSLRLVKRERR